MDNVSISTDSTVYRSWLLWGDDMQTGWVFELNQTLVMTWLVMALVILFSFIVTRKLSSSTKISRGQNLLEVLVGGLNLQIREVSQQEPGKYLPFIGSMFIFILVANLIGYVPGLDSPTASLTTTTSFALLVMVAVPVYGIAKKGLFGYLKLYFEPYAFFAPLNIVSEIARTVALAVRLYGNILSGAAMAAIVLGLLPILFNYEYIQPLLYPFVMLPLSLLGLLSAIVQAYIFTVLSMVFIAAATEEDTGDDQISEDLEEALEAGKAKA
ncbi:MAG: F0F1 ATP synthase subunit A [Alphaproteobacteria bacterium]|nr:F0F1 ATP synthase subunit A [Alphaproteobacteria bacterium]